VLSPYADRRFIDLPRPAGVILLAGPEGGFTDVETDIAQQGGFVPVRLGPRVLRTETAALGGVIEAALQRLAEPYVINDQILLKMANDSGLNATDAEVDVKFNEFKSQYTNEKFNELLSQQKMTVDEIRAELRKSITIDKLVNKEITSKISVTEGEIKDFYDKNKDSFNLPESYHVAHILVTPVADPQITNAKNDDAKNADQARQKAAQLLKQIQGGADFAAVARDYSEDPASAPNGGDLQFQPLQALDSLDPKLAPPIMKEMIK
jgi:peptidyl-prolyl cis-trans isomerase SurA